MRFLIFFILSALFHVLFFLLPFSLSSSTAERSSPLQVRIVEASPLVKTKEEPPSSIKTEDLSGEDRIKPESEAVTVEDMEQIEAEYVDNLVEASSGDEIFTYLRKVKEKIEKQKKYPGKAKREGSQGTCLVGFVLLRSGEVEVARVYESSGEEILDREAIAIVKRASPFEAFPDGVTQEKLVIKLPIKFIFQENP